MVRVWLLPSLNHLRGLFGRGQSCSHRAMVPGRSPEAVAVVSSLSGVGDINAHRSYERTDACAVNHERLVPRGFRYYSARVIVDGLLPRMIARQGFALIPHFVR
jgi:hypothetical protein